ncbi:DUF748 domain-containing protein [Uliginosibacterium sp. H1]|uniref:DUF748 domain-containing protein n=1 Tax=Uliginosibacterium sp. H1 TaxID=3114757 RepID=UPI002E19D53A|nr:DUF748 domain-containing protein [Uliginosibacterium sp. H1]
MRERLQRVWARVGGQARRRLKWAAISLACLVALVAVLGYLVLPPWIKGKVEQAAGEALGRKVSIEALTLDPFRLQLGLRGLRIAEADGQGEFVRIGSLLADAQLSSLFVGGPVLRELRVDEPGVNIERLRDGRFNFSDIVDRIAARPPKAADEDDEPVRFSVANIQLSGGSLRYVDQPEATRHEIDGLTISLPFLSNVPSRVDSFVEPRVAARINGAELDLQGQVRPFSTDHREASLALTLAPTALTSYLTYLPAGLPVQLKSGRLGLDLKLTWAQPASGDATLTISGKVHAADFALADMANAPVVSWKTLDIDLTRVEPLARPLRADIAAITLGGADLSVLRDRDGKINLERLRPAPAASKPAPKPASAPVAGARPAAAPVVTIRSLVVTQSGLHLRDESVPGNYDLKLTPLEVRMENFDLSGKTEASLSLKADAADGEQFTHEGRFRLSPLSASGEATATGLLLERLRPYYARLLPNADVRGKARLLARYSVADAGGELGWKVEGGQLGLSGFSLSRRGVATPLIQVPDASLEGVAVDGKARTVAVELAKSTKVRARVLRDKRGVDIVAAVSGGREDAQEAAREVVQEVAASVGVSQERLAAVTGSAPAADARKRAAEPTWEVDIKRTELREWAVRYEDRSQERNPVVMDVVEEEVLLEGLSTRQGREARVQMKGRVNKGGRVNVAGSLGLLPLRGDLKVSLKSVDILPAQPWLSERYRVLLTRGALSADGRLRFDLTRLDEPKFAYVGSLALADFNSFDQINDADFLRWKTFGLTGIDLSLSPLSFKADEVLLEDLYTRLILSADGELNLRELTQAQRDEEDARLQDARSQTQVASAPVPAPRKDLPPVSIGRIVLNGGNVAYTDRLIRPNYDAMLTELKGSLSGLSSAPDSIATLRVDGSVDRSAPLVIDGRLNPLRRDQFLDIKARVSGVDLTGASTYSSKYIGYGITRGRLSLDLAYKIENRRLVAQNHVVLNQLTFGEKVDSPDATKLPVMLAVAVLRDSRGDIDINLPVSGSLDDPQFSVGGVILRVIGNLITRAVTAPFSLLASMVSGGEDVDLAYVAFAPGTAKLDAEAEGKLQALSKALASRPALKLEIAGHADAQRELDAVRRAQLQAKLRSLKAQAMVKRGEAVGSVEELVITPQEYPQLLAEAYRAEPMDKPRNLIGMQRDVPVAEMETRLLANVKISDGDIQALARSRAQAVRNWLVDKGKVAGERLFIINAPNVATKENSDRPGARVDFSLQ